ncbi:hypothetical protein [Sporomusa silvacetica]|nr:hypothetical protein [Sporomusa silvacetica]
MRYKRKWIYVAASTEEQTASMEEIQAAAGMLAALANELEMCCPPG